jgi:hypothetical protein
MKPLLEEIHRLSSIASIKVVSAAVMPNQHETSIESLSSRAA